MISHSSRPLRIIALLLALTLGSVSLALASPSSQDKGDVEVVGHVGGMTLSMLVSDDGRYAFLGVGSGLHVFDVSDPARPREIAAEALRGGGVLDMVRVGNTIYAASYYGLRIVDVADPLHPTLTAQWDTEGNTAGVAVNGHTLYLADGERGLRILDISNPKAPKTVGTFTLPGAADKVEVGGDVAYVTCKKGYDPCPGAGIIAVDVHDAAHPVQLGAYHAPSTLGSLQVVGEDQLYVAAGEAGLQILDVSRPDAMKLLGAFDSPGWAVGVQVKGATAYLADGFQGVFILDVSNPAHPVKRGSYEKQAASVLVPAGDTLFVGGWANLYTMNVKQPGHPTLLGKSEWPFSVMDAFIPPAETSGQTAGATSAYGYFAGEEKLWVMDLTDPAMPKAVASIPYAKRMPKRVQIADGLAYVLQDQFGLELFDVHDPLHPAAVGKFGVKADAREDIFVQNGYAYIATHDGHGHLLILDMSKPAHPKQVGDMTTPGQSKRVFVAGHFAYVADGDAGLRIIDVSKPAAAVEVGHLAPPKGTSSEAIVVNGNIAHLGSHGDSGAWVQRIDVSDPAHPKPAATYHDRGNQQIRDIEVVEDRVFVAVDGGSMWELISRQTTLELASSYHAEHTMGVASYPAGDRIYHYLSGSSSYGDVVITTGGPGGPTSTPTSRCAVVGRVMPAKAKADGSQVIPPRVACQCGQEKVSFSAEAADGWALRGWDPGPKVQCPDSGEGEAVAIFMPTLTATGGRETAMCTAGENMTRTVLDFGLTASQADSWQVTSMTFSASGSGDDGKAIKHVRLYRGGSKLGEKRYTRDDGTVKFTFPKILIPVGKTVTFRLEYEFAPREMKHCSVEKQIFGVTLASHNAEPVHFAPGMRSGSPMGQVVAGCVKLKSASGGFLDIYDTIQDAVDLASDGQLIEVCPGDYIENVLVDKSLTIRSIGSRNNTFVLAADVNRPAIHIKKDNVTIDGFTIQRATGPEQAGVYVHGSVVQNTHILNNALSNNRYGLLLEATQGAEITDNLITTNKAHGVYLKNATQSVIQNNSLTDNQGDGILLKECQESADTWTSLQKNHVWGNGGSGIHLMGSQGVQINESATLSQNLEDGVLVESAAGAASVEHSMRVRITENATIQDNGRDGIRLKGGVDVEMRNNVIRENAVYGISVMDYAEDIRILGNTIAGNRRREEQIIGIYVTESGHVTIGSATNPNLIHSHKKYGVSLEQLTVPFDDGHAYLVTGNTIRANEGSGIHIEKACGVQVDGNTLGGKNGDGVQIVKSICMLETSNQILNNTIRQNLHHGVLIQESTESEIGLPGKGNIIKSNGGNGIELNQTASRMDAVNYIMSNTIRKNQMHGVALIKSKFDRVEERNQIEANGEDGVYLEQSNDIAVEGNVIEGMEEQKNGIHLVRSNDASIKFNTIKGHRTHGILVEQSNDGDANHLIQNIIRQNRRDGVHVQEACNVMIGDDSYKMGNNTIGPDNRVGVVITNCQCGDFNANVIANNQIQKNFSGVWVLNSEEVRIGAKNHILHHSSAGVMLWRSQGVVVKGNVIGPDNRNGIQIIQCQETEGKENEISDNEIKGNTNHDVFEESSNWLDISK